MLGLDNASVLGALSLLCLPFADAGAEPITFALDSGRQKVALLEVYTSEGCSSCPPADRFVNSLRGDGYYPARVIPLAFHVTYWDDSGWRDPYSNEAFDARQFDRVVRQPEHNVYTPYLLLDGRKLRATGGFDARLQALNDTPPAAHLQVSGRIEGAAVQLDIAVRIPQAALRPDAALYVALVESGLESQVSAGENRGRTLRHDHVVRQLLGPLSLPPDLAQSHHTVTMEVAETVKRTQASLAVFVQNDAGGTLQALAVPLERPQAVSESGPTPLH